MEYQVDRKVYSRRPLFNGHKPFVFGLFYHRQELLFDVIVTLWEVRGPYTRVETLPFSTSFMQFESSPSRGSSCALIGGAVVAAAAAAARAAVPMP